MASCVYWIIGFARLAIIRHCIATARILLPIKPVPCYCHAVKYLDKRSNLFRAFSRVWACNVSIDEPAGLTSASLFLTLDYELLKTKKNCWTEIYGILGLNESNLEESIFQSFQIDWINNHRSHSRYVKRKNLPRIRSGVPPISS